MIISDGNSICDPYTTPCITATVVPDPMITLNPANVLICTGGSNTLSVTATGGTPSLNYEWQSSTTGTGSWITVGTNSPTYNTGALTTTTYYRVIVSATGNGCNSATSTVATVTVVPDPVITLGPVGATICSGGVHMMTASATGDPLAGAVSYQWQIATALAGPYTNIGGATSPTYTTNVLTATRYYQVIVTQTANGCSTPSAVATVTVVPDPMITVQPVGATICTDGMHAMSVTATGGTPSLTYQWQSSPSGAAGSWTNIPSATTAFYTAGPLTITTYYRVLVSASGADCGTATSTAVVVTVVPDPNITVQPANTTFCNNGSITLSAVAVGGAPALDYQWQRSPIGTNTWVNVGTNSPTYFTGSLTMSYDYQVLISATGSGCDPVASTIATVQVLPDPVINIQPVGNTPMCAGGTYTMSVSASGDPLLGALIYQWQSSPSAGGPWTNVGANSNTYTTDPLNATTYYRVLISQSPSGCQTISSVVPVTVVPDPTITVQPVPEPFALAAILTFPVTGIGGTPMLNYQWQSSPSGMAGTWTNVGANSASYNTGALASTTYYQVILSATGDFCGTATSNVVAVTVVPDPAITANPVAATICTGGTQALSVTATGGTPSLNYQWQSSPSGLAGTWTNVGANSPNFTTSALTATTFYQVVITATGSDCNAVTSTPVAVTVVPDPTVSPLVGGTICTGGTFNLSVSASGTAPGALTYQWQSAPSATGPWTNVGTNMDAYMTSVLTTTTYYRVNVTQPTSGCGTLSNVVPVTVVADPSITAQPQAATICSGGSQTLSVSATGGTPGLNYQWQSSPNGMAGTWTNVGTGNPL